MKQHPHVILFSPRAPGVVFCEHHETNTDHTLHSAELMIYSGGVFWGAVARLGEKYQERSNHQNRAWTLAIIAPIPIAVTHNVVKSQVLFPVVAAARDWLQSIVYAPVTWKAGKVCTYDAIGWSRIANAAGMDTRLYAAAGK